MTTHDQGQINPAQITVRPITDADQPFLCHLYATTRAEEMALSGWSEQQQAEFLTMQFQAQHTHYQRYYYDATFDLLALDNQPIGRLYVHRGPKEIRIVDIALLPDYRRRGIGSHFLKQLLQEAKCSGKPLSIHVENFNPAMQLYKKLGFNQVDTNGIYHLMEWRAT